MLSARPRSVVTGDYQERELPTFPMMGIDDFCDRWVVTFATVAEVCDVDYRTVIRARNRHRADGTENTAIWLKLGIVDRVWRARRTQSSAA